MWFAKYTGSPNETGQSSGGERLTAEEGRGGEGCTYHTVPYPGEERRPPHNKQDGSWVAACISIDTYIRISYICTYIDEAPSRKKRAKRDLSICLRHATSLWEFTLHEGHLHTHIYIYIYLRIPSFGTWGWTSPLGPARSRACPRAGQPLGQAQSPRSARKKQASRTVNGHAVGQ